MDTPTPAPTEADQLRLELIATKKALLQLQFQMLSKDEVEILAKYKPAAEPASDAEPEAK